MGTPGVRREVAGMLGPGASRAADDPRAGGGAHSGVDWPMTTTGGNGKDGEKDNRAASKSSVPVSDDNDQKPPRPAPPSESDRASAAKSNPLRGAAGEAGDGGKTSKPGSGKKAAPELRISASMLSTQPPADPNTRPEEPIEPMRPTAGKARHRRRVKRLAQPAEPEVVNPLRLVWPRANSRGAARIASRYGFVGFILALIWVILEVRADTISQALNFSSTATAAAVVIGAIAAIALILVGYWYHSRLAALLALAGVITLVVLEHQAQQVSPVAVAGQAIVVYLLMHGVHGTIAYHVFGRRKRKRRSGYRYKSY